MSENFEEQRTVFENAYVNGADILAVLQGHHHISDKNMINGIDYYTFSSPKTVPEAHAIVEILYDGSVYIEGYGAQLTYNHKKPYSEQYDCLVSESQINSVLWDQMVKNHAVHSVKDDHDYPMVPAWRFGATTQQFNTLSIDLKTSGTVYESAQDGSINRWEVYDNSPVGAVVSNVFDIERQSQVINFDGASWTNGYVLRNENLEEWRDASKFIIEWSMKFDETYIVRVKVRTNLGNRYLRYTAVDYDVLGSEETINFGLGSDTQDGQWHSYTRDLRQDLALAQPGLEILSVNAFFIQGSGRVDDVKLHNNLPPVDTDGDGVADDAELAVYFTDPNLFDSDGDGINDGSELIYWSEQWSVDTDNDGLVNLIDPDADNDSVSDGDERIAGSNPADPASTPPPIVYEDAEYNAISRWEIYDNDPLGAVISNVFDVDRQSRVMDFNGASWTNGYALRNSALKEWGDDSGRTVLEWSMKYAETYIITAKVMTTVGARYIRYIAVDGNGLGTGGTVNIGLGSETKDGQWHTYVRDLQQDLSLAQPGVEILEVNAFLVQGSGRVDDVKLQYILPPADTDGDGISDDAELAIYFTDPNLFDSDGDGINDGSELIYWSEQWSVDTDNDGLVNLIDPDADNDSVSDGDERIAGSSPADPASTPPPIVYEDAEYSAISRWEIYDNDPLGAVISNVFDVERQSRVMDFSGASWTNGYALRNDALREWGDDSGRAILEWSMKYAETYIVTAKVMTTAGARYIRYTAVDGNGLGTGGTVNIGLGSGTKDGQWHTYVRDLQQDLSLAQPGVEILEVNAFLVQGSGRMDDVKLQYILPPLDTDGDGISDDSETAIYFTDPTLFDSDGDGISDGSELAYWSDQWNVDTDNDGLVNLIDPDADNDGVSDGDERIVGSDPADPASTPPPTVYEDAEDSEISRWEIYDNDPLGAVISNVFDVDRQSRVMDFSGASWTNGYALRNDALREWGDDSGRTVLEWSMKYAETYIITAKVMTTAGARYIRYTAVDGNGLGAGGTVNIGLGSGTKDGQWHTYVRDLQHDLSLAQPGVEILEVNSFFVQGTGRVDDIGLGYQ